MIKLRKSDYHHILIFEFTGEITKEQFEETVLPAVEKKVEQFDEINLVYILNTNLDKFTVSAWWKDAQLGIQNILKWNKFAVVTNKDLIKKFTGLFSVFIPGEFRGFAKDELNEAIEWVAI